MNVIFCIDSVVFMVVSPLMVVQKVLYCRVGTVLETLAVINKTVETLPVYVENSAGNK